MYDSRAYATFVSYFGTHYLTSATYGGKATMMSSLSNTYLGENSDLVANANAKIHFQSFKGVDVGASFSHASSSKDYQMACSDSWSVQMIGGNSHLNMSQWSDWTDSVKQAPAQIAFRVVGLDRLMPDEARAVNFRRYLDEYYAANNHTEVSPPPAPIRLGRCECASFPYDGSIPNDNGLLVGMELIQGHIGGTRQYCTPCYSLAGKFGSAPFTKKRNAVAAKGSSFLKQRQQENIILCLLVVNYFFEKKMFFFFKKNTAKSMTMNDVHNLAKLKMKRQAMMQNSTCGAFPCLPGVDSIGVGCDVLTG